MQQFRRHDHDRAKGAQTLIQRLDRAAAAMNAFLLVIAFGLAGLYFTSFIVLHVQSMPPLPGGPNIFSGPSASSGAASGPTRR
ncbi:MAG TPA: hypothetical protein VFA12_09205 [Stellaceae bacterium]|nr:hypothetical protein [Stellaceae bacterium]